MRNSSGISGWMAHQRVPKILQMGGHSFRCRCRRSVCRAPLRLAAVLAHRRTSKKRSSHTTMPVADSSEEQTGSGSMGSQSVCSRLICLSRAQWPSAETQPDSRDRLDTIHRSTLATSYPSTQLMPAAMWVSLKYTSACHRRGMGSFVMTSTNLGTWHAMPCIHITGHVSVG